MKLIPDCSIDLETGKEYISYSQAEKETGVVRKTKAFLKRFKTLTN
jgi:uncharacterized protein YlzI (FlbEa/FlbD family)